MLRPRLFITALALLAAFTFSNAYAAKGDKPKEGGKHMKEGGVKGPIVSIDKDANSIVVSSGGKNNPQQVTIALDANCTIKIDGEAKTLADLQPGQMVQSVAPASGKVTELEVKSDSGKNKKHGDAPASGPASQPGPGN